LDIQKKQFIAYIFFYLPRFSKGGFTTVPLFGLCLGRIENLGRNSHRGSRTALFDFLPAIGIFGMFIINMSFFMKNFFKWLGKHIAGATVFSLFSLLFVSFVAHAINYPSTPPVGEAAGGKFMGYFTKMLIDTNYNTSDGTVKNSQKLNNIDSTGWQKRVMGSC